MSAKLEQLIDHLEDYAPLNDAHAWLQREAISLLERANSILDAMGFAEPEAAEAEIYCAGCGKPVPSAMAVLCRLCFCSLSRGVI